MVTWQSSSSTYPLPTATHKEVVEDADLFYRLHDSLLKALGIKLRIPKVGGIEVDLHRLYKEVTLLGGIELVINRKQWVIVCEPFSFPPSFTNKSYVIKKLYVNAMHHFEQVYFHRTQGPLVDAPTAPDVPYSIASNSPLPGSPADRVVKRKPECHSESPAHVVTVVPTSSNSGTPTTGTLVSPELRIGTRFTGVIDSNFEHGYTITLNLPNQCLQGVLYKQSPPPGMPLPGGPASQLGRSPHMHGSPSMTGGRSSSHHRHMCAMMREEAGLCQEHESGGHHDPSKRARAGLKISLPRPARTPYQFFELGVNREQLMQLHPDPGSQAARDRLPELMSDLWHQMTLVQSQPFLDMAADDQVRYDRDVRRMAELEGAFDGDMCAPSSMMHGDSGGGGSMMLRERQHSIHHGSAQLQYSHGHHHQLASTMRPDSYGRAGNGRHMRVGIPAHHGAGDAMVRSPEAGMVPALQQGSGRRRSGMVLGQPMDPHDREQEELDHLCHYGAGMAPKMLSFDMQQGDNHFLISPSAGDGHGHMQHMLSRHNEMLDAGVGLDDNGYDFEKAMKSLTCDRSSGGAAASIDLFGCSALVQVEGSSAAVKAEAIKGRDEEGRGKLLLAAMPPPSGHEANGKNGSPLRRLPGQERPHASSSAGSPCDANEPRVAFHGDHDYLVAAGGGARYPNYHSRNNTYDYTSAGAGGDALAHDYS